MQTPPIARRRGHAAVPAVLLLTLCSSATAQLAVGTGPISEVWNNNCAICHGVRGQGGGAGTSTLLGDEFIGLDAQLLDRPYFDAIKVGVPEAGMPGFGETMSDAQIWALTVYLRELQYRDYRQRNGSPTPDADGVYESDHHRFRIEHIVTSTLRIPWSVDFLPDGRMLVAERPGSLRVHSTGRPGGTLSEPVKGTPAVLARGQGGLMEVALHPEFAENGWIYLAFTDAAAADGRRGASMTKVVRGRISTGADRSHTWTDQETIYAADPGLYIASQLHFGCRIAFEGPLDDGRYHVYFPIGDRGRGEDAQNLALPNGKIHRVYDDGTVPADNPFNSAEHREQGALPTIWSYGHRNPQGLAFNERGELWSTEHGPRGGDELNLVRRGGNYGWPRISQGINYPGSPYRTPWPEEGEQFEMPVDRWLPSIGACGLDVGAGDAFERWSGDLFAGGLSGQNVDRFRIGGDAGNRVVVEREELLHGLGRVRDVCTAPDGTIYVVLNDPDSVVRLVPVMEE